MALFSAFTGNTQTILHTGSGLVLPKDSLAGKALFAALNDFLLAVQAPNEENRFVLDSGKAETFVLLDEVKDMEKVPGRDSSVFCKPYLMNAVPLGKEQYLIQVAYIGTKGSEALLRAAFTFIAHPSNGAYLFSSPLLRNTRYWKTLRAGGCVFHYQHRINRGKVASYSRLVAAYDKKLGSSGKQAAIYCCEDLPELERLVGVDYKLDYNGRSRSIWSAVHADTMISVWGNGNAGFDEFDSHDLWHERLALVTSRSRVNRAVDEGCAYLYGGSWGLSWKQIFEAFREQIAGDENIDWAELKEKPLYFKTNGFNNSADYIVNALLIRKIERERGFAGVWELLNAGKEQYYTTLEQLTGITRSGYNDAVWKLIREGGMQ